MSVMTMTLVDSDARAGQLVMLAAQLVTVRTWVVRRVNVVCSPVATVDVVGVDPAELVVEAIAATSEAVYDAKSAAVADEACATGAVVERTMVSVTTITLVDFEAGQFVMLAAQLVIVRSWVVVTVKVVCSPESAETAEPADVVAGDDELVDVATAATSEAVYDAKSAEVAAEASDTGTV